VNAREHKLFVLKTVEARKCFCHDKVAEEFLGGVVGGDARGDYAANAPSWRDHRAVSLGEDRVGVDAASTAQRKPAAVTDEVAEAVSGARRPREGC